MRTIPLKNSELVAMVDDLDYEALIVVGPWYLHHRHAVIHGRKGGQSMSVILLDPPSGMEVDHIDRNELNNQRANLRLATRSQNCANRGLFKNNKTGYIGVVFHKTIQRYQAYINKDGKRICIGTYDDPIVAAKKRDAKAIELFGLHTSLNFPL